MRRRLMPTDRQREAVEMPAQIEEHRRRAIRRHFGLPAELDGQCVLPETATA